MQSPIDLRSDTVTRPTPAMRDAMMRARLGDDVLGDDPTVQELEERFAALTAKAAAVFVPSGTMGNQAAIRAHTQPGDEVIAHEDAHIVHYEGGAPAVISGCMVRCVRRARGAVLAQDVLACIRPDNDHFARSSLVCYENTNNRAGGSVLGLDELRESTRCAREAGLKVLLDGARLWNASVASGVSIAQYAACADSVTCCFSKGLGAPVGSCIAGDKEFIRRARRARKMLGGGMRQAGLLAAACLYAMDHHVQRLQDDHANARAFADAIANVPGLAIDAVHLIGQETRIETNLVYFELKSELSLDASALCERLRLRGVWMLPVGARRVRAVTHLDASREQVLQAADVIRDVCFRA